MFWRSHIKKEIIRRNRFRRVILPQAELKSRAEPWARELEPLARAWRHREISDAEAAALYLLMGLQFWFPDQWLSSQDWLVHPEPPLSSCQVPLWIQSGPRLQARLAPVLNLHSLINRFGLKTVRKDARQALWRWLSHDISLHLTDRIPTPLEILELQVQGKRWVTALFKPTELAQLVHDGRDSLSFLLHDLGHAQKFYSPQFEPEAQIGCYRLLLQALQSQILERPTRLDPRWPARLHYLIADLNSHPAHIFSVLWATAREAFELGGAQEQFSRWREELYELWQWSRALRTASEEWFLHQKPSAALILSQALKNRCQALFPDAKRPETEPGT